MLQHVSRGLGYLQERYPAVFGFMNCIPMNPYQEVIVREADLGPDAKVLDLGCGRGHLSTVFDADRYVGIDSAATFIAHAQRRNPRYTYRVMDATRLEFDDSSFDCVVVMGVFHHMDDETSERTLREIGRVLTPDGRCVILEPVPVHSRWNVVSHVFKRLDQGRFIRPYASWLELIGATLTIRGHRHELLGLTFNDCIVLTAGR
jgi:ubiquinone/menaquinone biosynthesis C-methylase UbiE